MKIILKTCLLFILLPLCVYGAVPENIREAIQSSEPDLLQDALDRQFLNNKQKNECIELANEVLRLHKLKMNHCAAQKLQESQEKGWAKISSVLIGSLGVIWGFGFIKLISETPDADEGFKILASMILSEGLFGYTSYKLWKYGIGNKEETCDLNNAPTKKYLNAFEITRILLDNSTIKNSKES